MALTSPSTTSHLVDLLEFSQCLSSEFIFIRGLNFKNYSVSVSTFRWVFHTKNGKV